MSKEIIVETQFVIVPEPNWYTREVLEANNTAHRWARKMGESLSVHMDVRLFPGEHDGSPGFFIQKILLTDQ